MNLQRLPTQLLLRNASKLPFVAFVTAGLRVEFLDVAQALRLIHTAIVSKIASIAKRVDFFISVKNVIQINEVHNIQHSNTRVLLEF